LLDGVLPKFNEGTARVKTSAADRPLLGGKVCNGIAMIVHVGRRSYLV
jgi:hypothetical protein